MDEQNAIEARFVPNGFFGTAISIGDLRSINRNEILHKGIIVNGRAGSNRNKLYAKRFLWDGDVNWRSWIYQ